MAPKKRKSEGSSQATEPADTQAKQHTELNKDYLEALNAAVMLVRQHEQFDDLINVQPLDIGKGGTSSPFNACLYDKAMKDKSAGSYVCGGNIFWVDPFFSVLYGIPYSKVKVLKVANHRFARPAAFPFPISIPVKTLADWKPMDHKGALEHQTPEEMLHAWYFAVARDIEAQADMVVLQEWRRFALTTPMSFLMKEQRPGVNDSDVMYFEQYDFRKMSSTDASAMKRSPFQQIYEVQKFKERQEVKAGSKLSVKQLAALYKSETNQESLSKTDRFSDEFLEKAMYCQLRLMPQISAIIVWADEHYGEDSPWNSIYKIHACLCKTKEHEMTKWYFECFKDSILAGNLDPASVGIKDLTGDVKKGRKGLIDLFEYKKEVWAYLTGTLASELNLSSDARVAIRDKTCNHSVYRQYVKGFDDDKPVQLSWKKGWSNPEELFLKLIDDAIYDTEFDPPLRAALKARRSPKEALDMYTAFKERVDDIRAAIKEGQPPAKPDAAAGAASGATSSSSATASTAIPPTLVTPSVGSSEDDPWKQFAERMVDTYVTLLSDENMTETQLAQSLKGLDIAHTRGKPGTDYVGIWFDPKLASETVTAPHIRVPPLRKERLWKLCHAVRKSRVDPDEVQAPLGLRLGDVFITTDAGKPGNKRKLHFAWKDSDKKAGITKSFQIIYDENSVKKRKIRSKGVGTLQQSEGLYFTAKDSLALPEINHKHYTGSNKGTVISFVKLPDYVDTWSLPFGEKKKVYGSQRVAVGGKTEKDDDDSDDREGEDEAPDDIPPTVADHLLAASGADVPPAMDRTNDRIEPMSYHAMPREFYEDLLELRLQHTHKQHAYESVICSVC